MVNYSKYQKNIVNQLLASGRVIYKELPDDRIIITCDGYSAIVLSKKQVVFALDRCEPNPNFTSAEITPEDIKMTPTKIFKRERAGNINKWRSEEFDVWLNDTYEGLFGKDIEIWASSSISRVLVTTRSGEALGIVMPVRATEENYA